MKPVLAEDLAKEIERLSLALHRYTRRKAFLEQELTRLRIGQSENLTRARLSDVGIKI